MNKTLLTVLITSFSMQFLSAQSNFKDAIVIANNGDTLHGRIDYRNWRSNPRSVTFMGADGRTNAYTSADIRGFVIPEANEKYLSATVGTDPLPENPNKALDGSSVDPEPAQRRFLLQLVSHPSASLLLLDQGGRNHFYYLDDKGEPVELVHHFEMDKASGQLKEVEEYKGQLATLFKACPASATGIERLRYQTEDLKKTFNAYLQCAHGVKPEVFNKKDSIGVRFGIVGGAVYTAFSFEGANTDLVDGGYGPCISPVIGGMIDFGLSRNLNRLHIVNELVYKNYETGSTFTRPFNFNYTRTTTVTFDLSYLQLNTMARYLFAPLSKVNPYLNLGISNAFMIMETKNTMHRTYSYGDVEDLKAIDGIKKYEFIPLVAGAGVNTRHFSAEVRYSYNKRGFSSQYSLEVNPRSWWLLVTYKF